MGFYYNADLFNHSFFKNKRKSSKNKKEKKIQLQKQLQVNRTRRYNIPNNKSTLEAKKKAAKLNYLKKLNKIKAERQKRVDLKLTRDFKEAKKTHPYFLNIKKGKFK